MRGKKVTRDRACNHVFETNLRHNVKFILKNTKQHKLSLPAPFAYLMAYFRLFYIWILEILCIRGGPFDGVDFH